MDERSVVDQLLDDLDVAASDREEIRWHILRTTHGSAVKDTDQWQDFKGKRVARGAINVSIPPFAYKLTYDPDIPIWPDPATAVSAREAFRLYATGIHSTRTIADPMARQGIRGTRGKPLNGDALREVFGNPVYIGLMRINEKGEDKKTLRSERPIVPANHPPIISAALFYAARQVAKGMRSRALVRVVNQAAIFQRRAVCAYCGETIKLMGRGNTLPDGTWATYYIEGYEETSCIYCEPGGWERGSRPVLSDESNRMVTRLVKQCLTEWARVRLHRVTEIWQQESKVVQQVAKRQREQPDFLISDEETVREVALASIWRLWSSARRVDRRNMAHVVLARVPIDPQSGWVDPSDIEWRSPFDKYAPD
ncbi:MAG: hypothetical protein GY832_39940 [Chloroflexi bacterium]|nr:hypothetical protein [Chloroflexota bacterium]